MSTWVMCTVVAVDQAALCIHVHMDDVVMQGLPEGHTEACYPVLRPGVDSHRAPPLKDSDADKREVCHHSSAPCTLHLPHACTEQDRQ